MTFFGSAPGEDPWKRRGEDDARIQSAETRLTALESLSVVVSDTTVTGWTPTTSYSAIGVSITLPAGKWIIEASGWFDWSEAAAQRKDAEIRNTTDSAQVVETACNTKTTDGQMPFHLMAPLDLADAKTFDLRAKVSAVSGTQLIQSPRLWARAVRTLS